MVPAMLSYLFIVGKIETPAENGSFGDLSDALGFGYRNREPLAPIHVQHHMDVRAAVTHVNDSVAHDLNFGLQIRFWAESRAVLRSKSLAGIPTNSLKTSPESLKLSV